MEVSDALISAIGLAVLALTVYGVAFMRKKVSLIDNVRVRDLLDSVVSISGQKVLAIEQTVIHGLKQEIALGAVSKDDLPGMLAAVKRMTIDAVVRDTDAMGLWGQVVKAFKDSKAAEAWLSDLIESQVAQIPQAGLGSPIGSGLLKEGSDAAKPVEKANA